MEILSSSGTTTKRFDPVNLYASEIQDFIAFLQDGASVGTSVQEACQAIQILEAITESYKSGQAVSLEEVQ